MKKAARLLVFVLCVGFTVAAIVNVFADNSEVEQMAKNLACEGIGVKPIPPTAPPGTRPSECPMTVTKMSRSPFGQSFELTGKAGTRHIRCERSLLFAGSYSCAPE
ncbi:MAG: hypothetical protein R3B70_31305 [Polyangiaceae bacterium]